MIWKSNQEEKHLISPKRKKGYPIKMYGMYDIESDYVKYIGLENISPEKVDEYTYIYEKEDIAYMSVFLADYEDFNNKKWKNPIMENVLENQGKKLDEIGIYYFTFH